MGSFSYLTTSIAKLKVIPLLLMSTLLLPATGCSLFGDSVSGDSQSGGISLQDQIRNLVGVYDVTYDLDEVLSTCDEVIPTFTVPATATAEEQNDRIVLRYRFADAPVAISGFYETNTDEYEGETTPVLIQGTQYAVERWSVGFRYNTDQTTFSGGSVVDFGPRTKDQQDVDPDCSRIFDISGIRISD